MQKDEMQKDEKGGGGRSLTTRIRTLVLKIPMDEEKETVGGTFGRMLPVSN